MLVLLTTASSYIVFIISTHHGTTKGTSFGGGGWDWGVIFMDLSQSICYSIQTYILHVKMRPAPRWILFMYVNCCNTTQKALSDWVNRTCLLLTIDCVTAINYMGMEDKISLKAEFDRSRTYLHYFKDWMKFSYVYLCN